MLTVNASVYISNFQPVLVVLRIKYSDYLHVNVMLVCCKGRDALVLTREVSEGLYFHGSFQKEVTLYQLQNIIF
jgi:hypothetical protein